MNRPAGPFGAWLAQMRAVLRGVTAADVPCDGCVGCCVSSYPIPLRPADQLALERVPDRYLQWQSAAGGARMHHREDGTCPMLEAGRCSIYAGRPQTCRDYDCRIYTAAGLTPDGERPVIRERVQEWCFEYEDRAAREQAAAVRRAASFVRANAVLFPAATRAHSATAAAVMAVKAYALFMDERDDPPPRQRMQQVLDATREFEGASAPAGDLHSAGH